MAGVMIRRWLPAALVAGAGAASLWARGRLPERVEVGFEGVLPFAGTPPQTAARWMVLWLMPALAVLAFALFRMAPTGGAFGRRLFPHAPADVSSPAQFERFGSTYDMIVLAVVLIFVGAHAAMLAAALQAPAVAVRILPGMLGACLVLMGNVMPRLRPNWVAGLRSRRLLEDPQLWRRTHRVFGAAFVVSGLATIGAAVAAPVYGVIVAVVALMTSLLIGGMASMRAGGTGRRASLALLVICAATGDVASGQAPALIRLEDVNHVLESIRVGATPGSVEDVSRSIVAAGSTAGSGTGAVDRVGVGCALNGRCLTYVERHILGCPPHGGRSSCMTHGTLTIHGSTGGVLSGRVWTRECVVAPFEA